MPSSTPTPKLLTVGRGVTFRRVFIHSSSHQAESRSGILQPASVLLLINRGGRCGLCGMPMLDLSARPVPPQDDLTAIGQLIMRCCQRFAPHPDNALRHKPFP